MENAASPFSFTNDPNRSGEMDNGSIYFKSGLSLGELVMSSFVLDRQTRSAMTKRLKQFLKAHEIDVKHTFAVKAIAEIFGHNEHSLASAIDSGKQITIGHDAGGSPPKCAVPGCASDAHVEVRHYGVVLGELGGVVDVQDFTCPYLCRKHFAENEQGAAGSTKPGGSVHYPYTNQRTMQGFSIYRQIFEQGMTNELANEQGAKEAKKALEVFQSHPVELLECKGTTFRFLLGELKTPITLKVAESEDGGA